MSGSRPSSCYLHEIIPGPLLSFSKGEATRVFFWWAVFVVGRFNAKRLTFAIEYSARVTPGCRLLLRDISKTGDAASLQANHRSETMRSGGDRAETRKYEALPV